MKDSTTESLFTEYGTLLTKIEPWRILNCQQENIEEGWGILRQGKKEEHVYDQLSFFVLHHDVS